MSLMILAAMMMAQAPAAAQPVGAAAPVAKKQKPQQVCEYIELTGSRSKRRVCHDVGGAADAEPGVRNVSVGDTKIQDSSTSATPGGSN